LKCAATSLPADPLLHYELINLELDRKSWAITGIIRKAAVHSRGAIGFSQSISTFKTGPHMSELPLNASARFSDRIRL
jgi:hypothetical protein